MNRIHICDPAWQTTFPFLVEPRENEWLLGLLLHCDEANHWGSGTTYTHILRMNEKTPKNQVSLIVPSGVRLDDLAQLLQQCAEILSQVTEPLAASINASKSPWAQSFPTPL